MKARRLVSVLCPLVAVLLLAVPALAVEKGNPTSIVRVTIDSSALTVEPETELDNGRIRLINPEGLEIIRDFKGGFGQVTVNDLAEEVEGLSLDGCWTYEVIGTPSLTGQEQDLLAESRETGRPVPLNLQLKLESMYQTGSFNIERGRMVFDPAPGEGDNDGKLRAEVPGGFDSALGISAEVPTGLERQVISGDLVVYNSICVGFDCPTNPSFGADTIRLQENNLRIHFDDTSTAASFPNRDWRILANDQANGGLSRFSVEDVSGNRIPFTIEAAAPSNALYVEDSGDVGFGTNLPVLDLHAVDGDTPALRLEQDGSSGFAPQIWDLAGNETSFFIRDATNGSTLPFRIRPGSSSNTLVIDDTNVGVGILSPTDKLHVRSTTNPNDAHLLVENTSGTSSARDMMRLKNNGNPRFVLENTDLGSEWRFTVNQDMVLSKTGTGNTEFSIDGNGDLTISGEIFTSGSCSTGCDLVFEPEYDLPTIEEHAALMWANKHLPSVGPTPENGPFNLSKMTGAMLNELEKAHIYIDQLNGTIQELQAELNEKDESVAALSERLAALEEAVKASQQ